MNKKRRSIILFWIAFLIYAISLLMPYQVQNANYAVTTSAILSGDELKYSSGIELIVPLFSLIPIILLLIFIYRKHSGFTRWFTLIMAIILVVPIVPFYYLLAVFCLFCKSEPGIGFYLHCISSVLFLSAMIIRFKLPLECENLPSDTGILDSF